MVCRINIQKGRFFLFFIVIFWVVKVISKLNIGFNWLVCFVYFLHINLNRWFPWCKFRGFTFRISQLYQSRLLWFIFFLYFLISLIMNKVSCVFQCFFLLLYQAILTIYCSTHLIYLGIFFIQAQLITINLAF